MKPLYSGRLRCFTFLDSVVETAKLIGDEIDDLRRHRPGSREVVRALTGMARLIQTGGAALSVVAFQYRRVNHTHVHS